MGASVAKPGDGGNWLAAMRRKIDALEQRLCALEAAPVLVIDPACKRCEGGRITWEEIHGDGLAIGDLCPCVKRREERGE